MKRFRFICDAKQVAGAQSFIIEAKSLEEAKSLSLTNAEFEEEEIEVTALGEPYGWEEVTPSIKKEARYDGQRDCPECEERKPYCQFGNTEVCNTCRDKEKGGTP